MRFKMYNICTVTMYKIHSNSTVGWWVNMHDHVCLCK